MGKLTDFASVNRWISLILCVASEEGVGPVGQCAGKPFDVLLKLAFDR